MFNSEENLSAVWDLTVEEIEALQAHVESLYQAITEPTEDDTFYYEDLMTTFPILLEELVEEPALMLPDGYIYFDLYYGDVTITDTTYSGYIGTGVAGQKVLVSDKHSATNNYYIFQSKGEAYTEIPQYQRVMGGNWGNYITNNKNVENVINTWETEAAKVGRAPTPAAQKANNNNVLVDQHYRIIISASNATNFDITIDNVWSGFQNDDCRDESGKY